jgi:hypothetical protein
MGQVVRLGSGGLRIPAAYTRIGVFHYREGSDWIGELRLPEEVFAAESLASLRGVPLTLLHPDVPVTRTAWPLVARGHVCDDVHVDGIHVRGHVVAAHPELCLGIEGGELCELSCGYIADVEVAAGEWQGTPYQRIQRRIRYDHVAVGPSDWARGGPSVRLILDGGRRSSVAVPVSLLSGGRSDRPVTHYRADDRAGARMSLKFLREKRVVEVGGREFDLTKTDQVAAAREAVRADTRRRTDALDPAQAAMVIDELRGHLDVANQLLMELAANLVEADVAADQAMSPEQLDAKMEEYADTIPRSRPRARPSNKSSARRSPPAGSRQTASPPATSRARSRRPSRPASRPRSRAQTSPRWATTPRPAARRTRVRARCPRTTRSRSAAGGLTREPTHLHPVPGHRAPGYDHGRRVS